jgi:hypothetical protein
MIREDTDFCWYTSYHLKIDDNDTIIVQQGHVAELFKVSTPSRESSHVRVEE